MKKGTSTKSRTLLKKCSTPKRALLGGEKSARNLYATVPQRRPPDGDHRAAGNGRASCRAGSCRAGCKLAEGRAREGAGRRSGREAVVPSRGGRQQARVQRPGGRPARTARAEAQQQLPPLDRSSSWQVKGRNRRAQPPGRGHTRPVPVALVDRGMAGVAG